MKENLISDKSLIYQWTFNNNMSVVGNPRVKATVFGNPIYNNGIATFNGWISNTMIIQGILTIEEGSQYVSSIKYKYQ